MPTVSMILTALAFLLCVVLTGVVRQYALRSAMLDIPNERSSHTVPTPRGGGLAISITVLSSVIGLWFLGELQSSWLLALGGGGLLVSLIGWIDDHRHVSPVWRALGQLVAAYWAMYWIGGLGGLELGYFSLDAGWPGLFIAGFVIAWIVNLYNFMDGSDGIASIQGISAASTAAILLFAVQETALATLMAVLAAACCGFLVWNWPPAKIFMGDVGSYLLGFMFAVVAVITNHNGSVSIFVWLILLGVFFWDASFTLMMRFKNGEKWYSAHKSHAYQRIIQCGYSHRQVMFAVLFIDLFVLIPLAVLTHLKQEFTLPTVVLSTLLMFALWCYIQRLHGRLSRMECQD